MRKTNRMIQSELLLLVKQKLLSEAEYKMIAPHYPPESWDLLVLIRSFTLIGAVAAGIGAVILVQYYISTYLILELIFGVLTAAGLAGGYYLKRERDLPRGGDALELAACFTLSGLTFTLGLHFSTGSGNWPALVGIDAVLCAALAYALNNRWVLIYALANVFVFLGGESGYISGWGMYWLGMDYPTRYVLAGLVCMGIAFAHRYVENEETRHWRNFNRVYLHYALLIINLSMWFFALFGYYNGDLEWHDNEWQRWLFTILWMALSAGSIFVGTRLNDSTFRSYGLVFLIINIYTAYFQFVAAESEELWLIHFFLIGGSMIALAFFTEFRRRRKRKAVAGQA